MLTFIGLIMGFVYTLNAQQTVQFYDEDTWQPIAGVEVQMGLNLFLSDQNGKISINEVFSSSMISISHPDYESIILSYSLIMEKKYKIGLKSNANTFDETVISASKVEEKRKMLHRKFKY